VKLRKCDLKDIKKRNKIVQICQYSFQEVLKFPTFTKQLEDGKQIGDVVKMWDFRHKFVLMIEGYLRLAGYSEMVAILGLKFSFSLKSSKHTLCIFEIGDGPTKFHIILYELAYIDIASQNLMAEATFE
jgi:hypothetical protein